MNNKGMTLTELLVSIVMLTVAIVLMYGLMSNLQKKKYEVELRADELIKIADIEKAFQTRVMKESNYGRNNVSKCSGTTNIVSYTNPTLTIKYKTTVSCNQYEVAIRNGNTIELKNLTNNDILKWTMKKSCSWVTTSSNTTKNIYNYVISCTKDGVTDYIKFPMYFSSVS